LLDKEIPENALRDLPKTLPLDQVIQLLLTGDGAPTPELSRRFGVPGFRGILVINEASDPTPQGLAKLRNGERADQPGDRVPMPTLGQVRPPQWFDSKKTVKKGKKGQGKTHKHSYWDAITDLCVSAGYIVYMRTPTNTITLPGGRVVLPATEIVISTPRTYYKDDAFMDPNRRVFIHGVNVNELKISRKLRGVKVPSIEVRAYDPVIGETRRARFPPNRKVNRTSLSGKGDREEIRIFVLDDASGPGAQGQLDLAARSIY